MLDADSRYSRAARAGGRESRRVRISRTARLDAALTGEIFVAVMERPLRLA